MVRSVSRRAVLAATAGAIGLGLASCQDQADTDASATKRPTARRNSAGSVEDSEAGLLSSGTSVITSKLQLPRPFQIPLPIPEQLKPHRSGNTDYYDLAQSKGTASIIPGFRTPIWGYNGTFPGPTLVSTSGRRTVVRHRNDLDVPTVTHLHGGRTSPDQDGYATDYLLPAGMAAAPEMMSMPGMAAMPASDTEAQMTHVRRDYVYPMQQRAATLWYHDHRMGFTGPSINQGLAGFHLVHDEEEAGLSLPDQERDIPLMICDRAFAADGSFLYPSLDPDLKSPGVQASAMQGVLGDTVLVNGAPWPRLAVGSARYRFRILNASNARIYRLELRNGSHSFPFVQIGTDGGLLAAPVEQPDLVIAPAQRFDVIVDFGAFAVGDEITMLNQAGSGTTTQVMRFIVDHHVTDESMIPQRLSTAELPEPKDAIRRRDMSFAYDWRGQAWMINGHPFDPATSEGSVRNGDTELWTITSDAHHPVHLHLAPFRVVSRNGGPPGRFDHGSKDTVLVGPGDSVVVAARFQGSRGRYMLHCHNLEHEDMAMMANFRIVE